MHDTAAAKGVTCVRNRYINSLCHMTTRLLAWLSRYGPKAAEAARLALGSAVHVVEAHRNMGVLRPTSIAKETAKHTLSKVAKSSMEAKQQMTAVAGYGPPAGSQPAYLPHPGPQYASHPPQLATAQYATAPPGQITYAAAVTAAAAGPSYHPHAAPPAAPAPLQPAPNKYYPPVPQ